LLQQLHPRLLVHIVPPLLLLLLQNLLLAAVHAAVQQLAAVHGRTAHTPAQQVCTALQWRAAHAHLRSQRREALQHNTVTSA
jgi:hypothetical protein